VSASDPVQPSMENFIQSLGQEFPDKTALIDRLRHRDPAFRRLVTYYESLKQNIHSIEMGREEASPAFLEMLCTQRDQARQDLTSHLNDAPPY
jgi:uncharacterized protein YdcH (DUF465 family)